LNKNDINHLKGTNWKLVSYSNIKNDNIIKISKNEKYTLEFDEYKNELIVWDDCPEYIFKYIYDGNNKITFLCFAIVNIHIPGKKFSSFSIIEPLKNSYAFKINGNRLSIYCNKYISTGSQEKIIKIVLNFIKK